MTATRSQNSAMTPRSWVIMSTAVSISATRVFISSNIWAWMVTSRAEVGSSAMSSRGRVTSIMAIMTRWAMPPESS